MLAVANMGDTVSFYTEVLGFSEQLVTDEYSIVVRDESTIHFI